MGSDAVAVVIYLGLLVPDTSTGPRKPPLRGLHCHVSGDEGCLALTQSPRQGRRKYRYPPSLQLKWLDRYGEAGEVANLSFTHLLSKFIGFKDIYAFF